jgi:AAA family ATP:ADP antiporter
MVIATALFSIVLVVAGSSAFARITPGAWVPTAFAVTAILILGTWTMASFAPRLAAGLLYVLVSGVGPLLTSGFWLIASERFDPHTAKRVFGQIAGAATLGGLVAGLAAAGTAGIDIASMLPLVAALNLACAWSTRRLSVSSVGARRGRTPVSPPLAHSGLRLLAETRYLQNLAGLVFMGAMATTLIDQAFKTQAQAEFGSGASLGRFFSLFYAALSLITFLFQTGGSRYVLEKHGLGAAAGTPALTLLIAGATALVLPGLRSLTVARGGEAIVRGSIYRAGYEVLYTPLAAPDKRAVKSIIDVGVDRVGDIVGATIAQQLLWMPQPGQTTALLGLAIACSGIGLFISRRLTRGYTESLERSLRNQVVDLELSAVEDLTTRTAMRRTLGTSRRTGLPTPKMGSGEASSPMAVATRADADSDLEQIAALRSRDVTRVLRALESRTPLPATVVSHVIPMLARDDVSDACVRALRSVAEERVGELTDALTDPNQPFAVRRRLAKVFSVCVSQRAVDGLLVGLEDLRFEVRYHCARSLLGMVEKNATVRIDRARIYAYVQKEVEVNREVWEKRRLLDDADEADGRSFVDELVRERASRSLAHVFTLLALALPSEPLRIAFRGLHTDDQGLRGTALEYLESVLPPEIRDRLWWVLADGRPPAYARPQGETLTNLLRSHQSIRLNLEALKKRRI